jgi:hypothetical protein
MQIIGRQFIGGRPWENPGHRGERVLDGGRTLQNKYANLSRLGGSRLATNPPSNNGREDRDWSSKQNHRVGARSEGSGKHQKDPEGPGTIGFQGINKRAGCESVDTLRLSDSSDSSPDSTESSTDHNTAQLVNIVIQQV